MVPNSTAPHVPAGCTMLRSIAGHGWGWTAYVLRDDPFGLYVRESDPLPDPELMHALGLNATGLGTPKAAPQFDR